MGLFVVLYAALFTVAAVEPEYNFSEIVAEEGNVKVTARIRDIDNDNCSYIEKWLLGHYLPDKCPDTVIDKLEVVYKGDLVHVPVVSYNDLVNIDKIFIQTGEESAYSVVIETGDGDDGHDIVLSFEEVVLMNRVVWNTFQKDRRTSGITEYFFDTEKKLYGARVPDKEYTEIFAEEGDSIRKIQATAIITERTTGNCNTAGRGWGSSFFGVCPRNQVERLIVTFLGDNVYIPVSAYSDLSDVSRMSVILIGSSMYVVYIKGGDASTSYEAFLHFEERTLTRRIAWLSIDPTNDKEETEYAYH